MAYARVLDLDERLARFQVLRLGDGHIVLDYNGSAWLGDDGGAGVKRDREYSGVRVGHDVDWEAMLEANKWERE